MAAPRGNKNAKRNKHLGVLLRINGPTTDLIYDFLASEGNINPSVQEIKDAIYYAIRQVYGRKLEEQEAIIL
jgi:hypothetical protein